MRIPFIFRKRKKPSYGYIGNGMRRSASGYVYDGQKTGVNSYGLK